MATAVVYEKDGTEAGKLDLPERLFGTRVNEHLVHEAVVAYLANQRQGDASTKERGDVRGGGRKPYRQKGTGRARAGTIRSPIYRGGGVVFGPHPRSYRKKMTRKSKRIALTSSLSARAGAGDILVIRNLEFPEPKTSQFASVLKGIGAYQRKVLFIMDQPNEALIKSTRNIPGVRTTLARNVNPYDLMWADKILATEGSIAKMEEVFKE